MMKTFTALSGQTLSYLGKDLSEGPSPAVFYFALSAHESLLTDPFNQIVTHLQKYPIRIFSLDLPAHGKDLLATEALKVWAEQIEKGDDPLTPFFTKTASSLEELRTMGVISDVQTATCGLSRGAYVAAEVAARLPWLKLILGFAPLTKLRYAKEFHHLLHNDIVNAHSLTHQIDHLFDKKLRFYISNKDTRVGTKECFDFIHHLAEKAHEHRIRSAPIELLIKPPLGHQGHGTSSEIFFEGGLWLLKELGFSI
jgi:esterase FrsA